MSDPDEWVTVAEAARRLGVDQRQARRYADRLKDTDRTPVDTLPLSVRLSAIVSARQQSLERSSKQKAPQKPSTDTDRTGDGQSAGRPQDSPPDVSVAMVEILREQITVKDGQLAERDAQIRALLRIVDEDREELRRLRAQLAIPEAPPVETPPAPSPAPRTEVSEPIANVPPAPEKRSAWQRFWDVILYR